MLDYVWHTYSITDSQFLYSLLLKYEKYFGNKQFILHWPY